MINCRILIYYHKKNCSKANVIHLFRPSFKNSTQNKNKINIKHRLLFSFLRSVLTSQDEVFCFRSDSLFSSAYILNILWRPCLCCVTQRVGITLISYLWLPLNVDFFYLQFCSNSLFSYLLCHGLNDKAIPSLFLCLTSTQK